MSNLKENLLKVIDSALELAAECEQTIEVRGAVKQLKQARGSISQHTESELLEAASDRLKDQEELKETIVVDPVIVKENVALNKAPLKEVKKKRRN